MLNKLLSDEMLEEIKSDKDARARSVAELDKFIGARYAFIRIAQKASEAAAKAFANKKDATSVKRVKAELKKIIDAATSPTPPSFTE
ncbi:hypothetical protein [Borrelia sp. P9F1]|uniref:hypothetical protein n=1 Tax=Borrelia sp. P9F1 TaxID=3058374 RepID=UPI0026483081|nr:hypothetical protein [Borrelia sp. P9F1]WKC58679.1 hypothetical protein QYZ68_05605 [Borrelia sp. P9F1]